MERVEGIEPSTIAWKAMVLPLNYTRMRGETANWRAGELGSGFNDLKKSVTIIT